MNSVTNNQVCDDAIQLVIISEYMSDKMPKLGKVAFVINLISEQ